MQVCELGDIAVRGVAQDTVNTLVSTALLSQPNSHENQFSLRPAPTDLTGLFLRGHVPISIW